MSSWTLSLWPQSSTTSLQTWEIRAVNGKRWQAFILGFPVVWKRLVKSFSVVARSPRQQVPSSVVSWPCYECGMTFKTSKTLASHQSGQEPSKGTFEWPLCQRRHLSLCGAFFHTRRRAMHHVDFGSNACKARLLSSPGLPELTEDEIALARQQDRLDYAAAKARGAWRNAGPPACPPLGGWTRPRTQRLQRTFLTTFLLFIFEVSQLFFLRGVRLSSFFPVGSSPCVSVICLCCFFPRHRRIPARPLVKTAPCFLMDSFVNGWSRAS